MSLPDNPPETETGTAKSEKSWRSLCFVNKKPKVASELLCEHLNREKITPGEVIILQGIKLDVAAPESYYYDAIVVLLYS